MSRYSILTGASESIAIEFKFRVKHNKQEAELITFANLK